MGRRAGPSISNDAEAGSNCKAKLDYLSNRAVEANVFFAGQFLAPALPRLKSARSALPSCACEGRKRARFLMPFSVERPGLGMAHRSCASGQPFRAARHAADRRGSAAESIDNVWRVGPSEFGCRRFGDSDLKINRPAAQLIRAIAMAAHLPLAFVDVRLRPMLESLLDGESLSERNRLLQA